MGGFCLGFFGGVLSNRSELEQDGLCRFVQLLYLQCLSYLLLLLLLD